MMDTKQQSAAEQSNPWWRQEREIAEDVAGVLDDMATGL